MADIEDLLRKREKLLQEIDAEISSIYTKPVTLLFTDIVGSTKYFEEMGDIAGRQMIQTHNDLLFPIVASHHGRIIKTIGDSIMASFEEPHEGILAAMAMQGALKGYNESRSKSRRISVRMGIHYGEAVIDSKDLFGDMVNTSARVEGRAEGEEILVSGDLKARVEDSNFPMIHLGKEHIRGKEETIDFYLVNWEGRDEKELLDSWKRRGKAAAPEAGVYIKTQKVVLKKRLDTGNELKKMTALPGKGNPYLNRVMIPHPDMFFGRKGIVKRIMRRISSESPQSISLVGERRIGKSSLLGFLRSPATRTYYLDDPDGTFFVPVDFQQLRAIDSQHLVAVLFQEIEKRFSENLELSLNTDLDGLRFLCDRITTLGLRLIFLFDEFESVTKNEKMGPDFYSFLRSLANNFSMAFVTATGRNLKDMCVSHEISDSPFFNIFSLHHLGLFKREEGERLVTEPSQERGIPLSPLMEKIFYLGGVYPFFLQMACSSWFEFLESEEKPAEEYQDREIPRDVLDFFREESEPHFEFVLESFVPEEREICRQVLAGKTPDPENPLFEGLLRKGYLLKGEGEAEPFSGEFRAFLSKKLG